MKSVSVWCDILTGKSDAAAKTVHDMCYRPDGTQIVVAAGNHVVIYDAMEGTVTNALKGHKDTVYCVQYAKDGKRFASGSADKTVIIWSFKGEGIVKYSHNDAIQCLSYNPITGQLASGAISDFALWAPEAKNVIRNKVSARITCASWTNDGQYLALGLANGVISLRNKNGDDTKVKIERPGSSSAMPVWALQWSPAKDESHDILAVADWNRKLSFYRLNGTAVCKDADIKFDPLFLKFFASNDFIVCGGSDKTAHLFTKEGKELGVICDSRTPNVLVDSWITCCAPHPEENEVVIGTANGKVAKMSITFSTVHGLYRERYVYRVGVTDVIVQHLLTSDKVRIRCKELIKKVAVYKNKLAIQLNSRILIYELNEADSMTYRIHSMIHMNLDCNLLVVTCEHVILCMESKLQSITFDGVTEREWVLDSTIRYIKVIGGAKGREGLLVALSSGQVLLVYIDNPFPISVLKHSLPIRCLDMSSKRKKIAIVDDESMCLVFDVKTKELLYQEQNANSVAWNTHNEEMLCFSGKDTLNIKASTFPAHQQKMSGYVVGFCGSNVFCLGAASTMTSVEVPQSAAMYQYLERKEFRSAYEVACLGVTDTDWTNLGKQAMDALQLEIAKQSFKKTRNLTMLELIHSIEERSKRNPIVEPNNQMLYQADISAYRGEFSGAAKMYRKSGQDNRAASMYTDLRMFKEAQEFMGDSTEKEKKELISKQAEWAKVTNDALTAATMFWEAGQRLKALEIYGESRNYTELQNKLVFLDKADKNELKLCAKYFKEGGQLAYAAEAYQKLGDKKGLVDLFVQFHSWEQAFEFVKNNPEFKEDVYFPYAKHLAEEKGDFERAQEFFFKAGKEEEAGKVLEALTKNAVDQNRFEDAGFFYWKLSSMCIKMACTHGEKEQAMMVKYHHFLKLSTMYYTFHAIHRYTEEPFTSHLPDVLFSICRFLLHSMLVKGHFSFVPKGISKVSAFFTLAKQSTNPNIAAYKLARQAYDNLQQLNVPPRLQESIDVGTLAIKAKPCSDNSELEPLCFRCLQKNPLLNRQGNICVNCKQPFQFSFSGFEILPLVEFAPEEGIPRDEVMRLISQEPTKAITRPRHDNRDIIRQENGYEQLRLGDDDVMGGEDGDEESAMERLINTEMMALGAVDSYKPIRVSKEILKSLEPTSVLVQKWEEPLSWQFHWMRLKTQPITVCPSCQFMFLTDDWFLASLSKGFCPFCRRSSSRNDLVNNNGTPNLYVNTVPASNTGYLNGIL